MSREKKVRQWLHAVLSTGLPAVGLIVGIAQCFYGAVGWFEITCLVVGYYLTGVGVEVGFHRLLSHRAFVPNRPLSATLTVLGSMALQGPPIDWAVSHRTHHRFSDKVGDLHSPHTGQYPDRRGSFWHAHLGWLFAHDTGDYYKIAPDLFKDAKLLAINRYYPQWVLVGLAIPMAIGALYAGRWGAFQGFLWGGLIRIFFVQHFTFITNSVCHSWGKRHFPTGDQSRNIPWLFPLTLGSSLHNSHHAHPSSAKTAFLPGHIDPSWLLIRSWRGIGWVTKANVPANEDLNRGTSHGRRQSGSGSGH